MVKDPETAAVNFLRALEKLPGYIEQDELKLAELKKDLPILEEVVNGTWLKEGRLSELKTELAGIERNLQLSLAVKPEKEGEEQANAVDDMPKESESIVRQKGVQIPRGLL